MSSTLFSQEKSSDCLNHVNGSVVSKQTGDVMPNATIYLKQNGKIIKESNADESGNFSFDLECDSRYQISAQFKNYTKNIKLVFTPKNAINHKIKLELYPINEFIEINNESRIIIESIKFLPDDYSITPKASSQLNIVYDLMEKYKHMNIEIRFHTDARGDAKFLLSLTQKRADVCANYLINRGIKTSRIYAKGYGATQLLNRCKQNTDCNNAQHLENRRTEFVVLKDMIISLN